MRKLIVASLVALAVILGSVAPTPVAQAQSGDLNSLLKFLNGRSVANVQTSENVDAAIIVRYVGSAANAQIEVNAGGDIIFTEDVGSGLAADASVLETGGTGGTIDVSDANADTLGEVVDSINAEADGNWVAAIHAGLRSQSSNNTLTVTAATSNVMRPEGQNLAWDNDEANLMGFVLSENQDGRDYFTINGGLLPNPFEGKRASLFWARYNITQGTALTLTLYSVRPNNLLSGGRETVTTLYQETLTSGSETEITIFNDVGISSRFDEKFLAIVSDSGTFGAFSLLLGAGYEYDSP